MKRFLVLLVVLAGGVAAAAFTVPSTAATVNGATIGTSALNGDLSAIAGSSDFQCLLDAQIVVESDGDSSLPPIKGVGSGTYNSEFVGYWLDHMINAQLVQQLATRHGDQLTSADLTTARSELEEQMTSTLDEVSGSEYECEVEPSAVLASLPASFLQEQIRQQAYSDLLLSQQPGSGVTTADLQQYFNDHRSDFESVCVSGIVVSSQSEAESLRSQIEGGASFAQLAQSDSIDTATASAGGALGCVGATSSEYSSLREDVSGLSVGQVSQPLSNGSGDYILLQLTSVTPATFSKVRSVVRTAVLSAGRTRSNTLLEKVARHAHVSVNPAYGRWSASSASSGVIPPASPPTSSVLSPAANIPSFSSSSSSSSPSSSSSSSSSSTAGGSASG